MKAKFTFLLFLAILMVTAALYARGRGTAFSRDGKSEQPKWLEIEVTRDSDDIMLVVLRMQERKLIGDYSLMLQTKSGHHKGMLVPVALTHTKHGVGTSMRLPKEIGVVSRLILTEQLKHAKGGNMYKIDVASYMSKRKRDR